LHNPILAPLITLVLWTFVMWAWLYATRIPAIRKNKIVLDPQRTKEEFNAQIPAKIRWKADNYNHLMEQPTLFLRGDAHLGIGRYRFKIDHRTGLAICWA
jgi:hypothetical protein